MTKVDLINVAYMVAAALFVFGIKGLTHPRTAVKGNRLGMAGMLLAALVAAYAAREAGDLDWKMLLAAIAAGSAVGWVVAVKVQMTAMPELVAAFNGFGGIASVLVAGAALAGVPASVTAFELDWAVSVALSGLIGGVTFTGSMIAYGKLAGKIDSGNVLLPGRHMINGAVALGCVLLGVFIARDGEGAPEFLRDPTKAYLYLSLLAGLLGILLVIPIGGADMPVVISLLNSYSGLAACATGFVIQNTVLIISGSLVGASGLILTAIMCKAMNRSLVNVIFSTMSASGTAASADEVYTNVKSTSAEELAMLLDGCRRVVIVPGYGLAVAQAQHVLRELDSELQARGKEVEYGIHPVAGRMPGHMNVLLAEADVPYEQLKEMELINPSFELTDCAIIVGANDVVNPVAREPGSPIAGMPILDVDKARTVVVIKRSLSPGFAGIPNPLFSADNTLMYFGDAKVALQDLVRAIKEG